MDRTFPTRFFVKLLFIFLLLSGLQPGFTQEEPESEEEIQCVPEDLTTTYDRMKEENVNLEQVKIWYNFGYEYFKYDKFKEAIPYYWKVIISDKSGAFKIAYSRLAECYFKLNEIDSTLIVLYRGLEKYPDYASLHFRAGQIHRTLGHISCAIPHYEALTRLTTDDPEALKDYWAILAQLYFQVEDERSIDAQRKVIELDPNDAEASVILAKMMDHFGMNPIHAQEEAFLKDTTNVVNARIFGKSAFEAGEYKKTLQAFKSVLKSDPKNVEALNYIARSYEALERTSEAILTYKKILNIDPNNVNILCSLAEVYSKLSNFTAAQTYVNKAIRSDPRSGLPHMVMGQIYEDAVSYCSNQRTEKGYTYDDKLVYELARKEYQKATRDPNFAAAANSRFRQLEPFIRTREDIHMHKREQVKDSCYEWIESVYGE